MAGFFRAHSSIVIAVGAGVVVGTTVTLLIQKLRHSLSQDLSRLVDQIENLRRDVETLRTQLEDSPKRSAPGTKGMKSVQSHEYFSAASSGDEDEFEEAYEG